MIAIVDYGMGNLASVHKAMDYLGEMAVVTADPKVVSTADGVILPGVGAAQDAMATLNETGLAGAVTAAASSGVPVLGICLGMQLLLDHSLEDGETRCLGLIEGRVVPFDRERMERLRVPHMGWNNLERGRGLCRDSDHMYMYFVHSYHAADVPEDAVAGLCNYGYPFVCAVEKDNVAGTQFHPEKSSAAGLLILKKFAEKTRHA